MATRIRYTNNNGTLVSKPIMSPNGEVLVNISNNGSFVITHEGMVLISNTNENDLSKAKKLAKLALKGLGVTFESEVRPRVAMTAEEEVMDDLVHDQ